ncbi:MAG TPA: hemerythrin domain-containing protein [Holophagaceae bacterium]|nr:hemerythrin domain-containing protein [Holophagaceae bacterium]
MSWRCALGAEARLAADHQALDGLLAEGVVALESKDAARAHRALDRLWMRLAVHIRAEHKALFPAVLAARPDLAGSLARLRADHDVFMETLARLLPRLNVEAPDFAALRTGLGALAAHLADHNALEEAAVYPAALRDGVLDWAVAQELAFLPERYET